MDQRILVLCLLHFSCQASMSAEPAVDYVKDIKPLLEEKCHACHGVLKQESELRLDTRDLMKKGGLSGPAIVPGSPEQSLILERVSADEDLRMPPVGEGSALKPGELALLTAWIRQGAKAPEEKILDAPTEHWAFQRIEKPGSGNSIDAFLEAKRQERKLKTVPAAERTILLRRVYLDLIGLPPTHEQLQDERPYEEIVEELLASPHHGERWGRHWMDVWRYTDWYGLGAQLRNSQKHIWHWRDWIVESLNADKGYDRMIREMIAGDELAPEDFDALRGTGFLARNYYLFNRTTWLDSTIEHTGKAFLGLTLNCAKCHDHKYDPITQKDYYRFRAIFEPHQVRLDPWPGETDFEKDGLPRVFDDHLHIETFLHIKGDPKNPDKSAPIPPGVPAILSGFAPAIEPVSLPVTAYAPAMREYVEKDRLAAAQDAIETARRELKDAREKFAQTILASSKAKEIATPKTTDTQINDDFSGPNEALWEVKGAGWKYQDGALQQTQSTREEQFVRLKKQLPRDFELTCRYTTTGGATYKSVTFRFDQTDDQKYANFVYTSAHAPGPKVQIAYTRAGNHVYPPQGRSPQPIKVGQTYELKFAVRDRLVNVWLDDKFIKAYQFPDRNPDGFLSLSGFDATVAFDAIAIRSLPPDVELTKAGNAEAKTVPGTESAVKLAEAKLKHADAKQQSLMATFAAERANYFGEKKSFDELKKQAAKAEALSLQAEAEYEMLLNASDANKRKAAEAKLKKAQAKLASVEKGEATYTPIKAAKKALETPAHKEDDYPAVYAKTSTGRRLMLARWIASRENPLTARVAVNHVWMRHFGEPLVDSVFDFGLRAERPEHAELLDFLAAEFMESGWSFKHLHRLIVTSKAYRLSSSSRSADVGTRTTDPNNRFYWRMNTRRMESQIVRDSLLTLAADLDAKLGGPSVDPSPKSRRRSLYFKHSRDHQDLFLAMFDDADHLQCYRRSESIVPQQALALANSQLALEMSSKIAERLDATDEPLDREQFIQRAFETLLARPPESAEVQECLAFCTKLTEVLGGNDAKTVEGRVRARLVHALFNHNDFISIR